MYGSVEKVRQPRFRPLVVLTLHVYAPLAKSPLALPEERCVLAGPGWAGETAGLFEHSLRFHSVLCHLTGWDAIKQILDCLTDPI